MKSTLRALRKFWSPIPERHLGQMYKYMRRAMYLRFVFMGFVGTFWCLIVLWKDSFVPPVPVLLVGGACLVWMGALIGWVRYGFEARNAGLVCFLFELASWTCWLVVPVHHGSRTSVTALCSLAAPYVLSAFVPIHPRIGSIMGLGFGVVVGVYLHLVCGISLVESVCTAVIGIMMGGLAAVASQFQRRLWGAVHHEHVRAESVNRLAVLGRRVGSIARDLRDPLKKSSMALRGADKVRARMLTRVEEHASGSSLEQDGKILRENIEASIEAVEVMAHYIQSVREQTRGVVAEAERAVFSVRDVILEVKEEVSHRALALGVDLEMDMRGEISLKSERTGLKCVVAELLTNALDAMEEQERGDKIHVRVWTKGSHLWIEVRDNGPGIPEILEKKVFEPMFTTKTSRFRAGLGLSVVRDLARGVLGGDLVFKSVPGGACFVLSVSLEMDKRVQKVIRRFRPSFETKDKREGGRT